MNQNASNETGTGGAAADAPSYADVKDTMGLAASEQAELDALDGRTPGDQSKTTDQLTDDATQAALDAAAKAEADAAAAAEAAKAPPAAAPPVVVAAPPAPLPPVEVPTAPKDFDAAQAALDEQYNNGEIESEEYSKLTRALAREEATFVAAKTVAEQTNADRAAQAQAVAQQSFDDASRAWADQHADFMANPLRQKAMQDAITLVDQKHGYKLTPAELFEKAQAVAFDAMGWKPQPAKDPAATTRAALQQRQPTNDIPTTLGGAPAAGIDTGGNFSDLDAASIVDLEHAVARMSPAELDKYLREVDAPIPQT